MVMRLQALPSYHSTAPPDHPNWKSSMTSPHILSAFDAALNGLSEQILTMGNDALAMVEKAGQAYMTRDVNAARQVVQADLAVDAVHDSINSAVIETLSRFQPVARDLRNVLAIEHMASALERIADHAKSISKRTIASSGGIPEPASSEILSRLCAAVESTVKASLSALEMRDADLAQEVRRGDVRIDRLYDDLVHSVIADMQNNPAKAHDSAQLLFVSKSLERIGDHATNIAEEVRFMVVGEAITATRRV